MPPIIPLTYVSFVFSPAFINESKAKETQLVEEEKVTALQPGTLANVLNRYKEEWAPDRDLSGLSVPRGALYFWFYDRLTVTTRWRGKTEKLQSRPLNESGRHYLENEGVFFTRAWLEMETKYPDLPLERRKYLIGLMEKHGNSDRIFQVAGAWDVEENFVLEPNDRVISPQHDVQLMFDTDIPWNKK